MSDQNFKVKHGIAITGSSQDTLLTSDDNGNLLVGGNLIPNGSTLNDTHNNTSIGLGALQNLNDDYVNGADGNTALGFNALNAVQDTRNTAIGEHAAALMQQGRNNVFVGDGSAENLTTGYGQNLTIIGHNTAGSLTTTDATNVTLVGAFSDTADGSSNVVAIGDHSFGGNNSISIGSQSSTNENTNSITIGYQTIADYDNQIKLGNVDTNRFTIPGLGIDWDTVITTSSTELNYVHGVTSAIQTQLNSIQNQINATSTGNVLDPMFILGGF
jgi:hypothetical protein